MDGYDHWETMFQCLGARPRRRILIELYAQEPEDTIQVPADIECTDQKKTALRQACFHNHLPKLAEAGYISWEEETYEVRRGPQFAKIQSLLKLIQSHREDLPKGWV